MFKSIQKRFAIGLVGLVVCLQWSTASELNTGGDGPLCPSTVAARASKVWDIYQIHSFPVVVTQRDALPQAIRAHIEELMPPGHGSLNPTKQYSIFSGKADSSLVVGLRELNTVSLEGSASPEMAAKMARTFLELNTEKHFEVVVVRFVASESIPSQYISDAINFPLPCEGRAATLAIVNILPDNQIQIVTIPPLVRREKQWQTAEHLRQIATLRRPSATMPERSSIARLEPGDDSVFHIVGNAERRLAIEEAIRRASYPAMPLSFMDTEARQQESKRLKYALIQLPFMKLAGPRNWYARADEGGVSLRHSLVRVDTPERGDVVSYESGGTQGIAIYLGNDLVERWIPEAEDSGFIHHILDVPTSFGTKLVFLRPPPGGIVPSMDFR